VLRMKKLIISLAIMSIALTSCGGDTFRKLDPRNDDSITYHNKFVENTNTILNHTQETGEAYNELLSDVENAIDTLYPEAVENTLFDLRNARRDAETELANLKSKNEADEAVYLPPFEENYIPALMTLEDSYDGLIEYLEGTSGSYDLTELEPISLEIDTAYSNFIEAHNVYIDTINLQI
jgi:hypothetical protein